MCSLWMMEGKQTSNAIEKWAKKNSTTFLNSINLKMPGIPDTTQQLLNLKKTVKRGKSVSFPVWYDRQTFDF